MKQFVDENNYPLFDGLVGLKQNPMKTAMQELIDDLRELKKHSKDNKQDTSFDIGMTLQ